MREVVLDLDDMRVFMLSTGGVVGLRFLGNGGRTRCSMEWVVDEDQSGCDDGWGGVCLGGAKCGRGGVRT